jgi:hypothetical protein
LDADCENFDGEKDQQEPRATRKEWRWISNIEGAIEATVN